MLRIAFLRYVCKGTKLGLINIKQPVKPRIPMHYHAKKCNSGDRRHGNGHKNLRKNSYMASTIDKRRVLYLAGHLAEEVQHQHQIKHRKAYRPDKLPIVFFSPRLLMRIYDGISPPLISMVIKKYQAYTVRNFSFSLGFDKGYAVIIINVKFTAVPNAVRSTAMPKRLPKSRAPN